MSDHNLPLDEGQRQALLMALAHLAIERPGWDWMLGEIAKPIDNPGPEMYNQFKKLRQQNLDLDPPVDVLMEALEESVKLQSHYAKLLNMRDGGARMDFADARAWLARLKNLKERHAADPANG